jgi:lipopolysaccharide export system protein LptA
LTTNPSHVLLAMLLALGAETGPALAASAQPGDGGGDAPQADTATPGGKVTITGDSFVVDDKTHQATFTGNVLTVQSAVTVHSDKVVTSYGKTGGGDISSFTASGHVTITTPEQTATGDVAVFDPKTQVMTLTGNVVVTNSSGRVQSNKLVVDLKTNKSTFTGNGGRVTGVFSSQ